MTPAAVVELAVAADAPAIAWMSRGLIEYGLPWTWQPARVRRAVLAPDTNVAVVRGEVGLAAFGIMEYLDEDAYLVLLAVAEAKQRQGLGRAVLGWLEASATAAGSSRVRVDARRDNAAARCFYSELGYHEVRVSPRRYDGRVDQVRLEKWLRAARSVSG